MTSPATATKPIGHIDRDHLRYHGKLPFTDWGKTWKRVLTHVPVDAAYALYDHYIRKTGVLPMPPLNFTQWHSKCFRIIKTEDGGESVIALYKHDDQFILIKAATETYRTWADKHDAAQPGDPADRSRPKYSEED
jgi:hypothetical protein